MSDWKSLLTRKPLESEALGSGWAGAGRTHMGIHLRQSERGTSICFQMQENWLAPQNGSLEACLPLHPEDWLAALKVSFSGLAPNI